MTPEQIEILKDQLQTDYVPGLPPLIDQNKPTHESAPKNISRAFAAFAIRHICDVDAATASAAVVDDFVDNGLDAIYYHPASKKLFLLQAKLKRDEPFKEGDSDAFVRGVRDLLNQRFDRFNDHVKRRQTTIDQALDDAKEIVLVVARTSEILGNLAREAINIFIANQSQSEMRLRAEWIDFGPDDVIGALLGQKAIKPVNASVYLKDWRKMGGARPTFCGSVAVSELAELFEREGNGLLEKNIRYFLGIASSGVNQAIQDTLRSRPSEFFYLSNGVTALAQKIEQKGKRDDAHRFSLERMSVINGAQTIASCHHFIRTNPNVDVSEARALLTLIEVSEGDDFGEEITKARNHQNPVAEHHFAALDRNQERLRRELAFYNIIYRYRPEETDPVRRVAVMYIKQAAVALALFDASPAIPVQLKRDTGVFVDPASDHYARVFPATLSGKHLANAVRVFRAASAALDSNEVAASGREKLIYRHGRYAIFWLMIRANPTWATLGHVISYQEAEGLVSKPLDDWRERVRSQAEAELDRLDKGPLAFFRNLTDLRPFLVRLRNEGIQ